MLCHWTLLVRMDIDVNEHERLSNFTLTDLDTI